MREYYWFSSISLLQMISATQNIAFILLRFTLWLLYSWLLILYSEYSILRTVGELILENSNPQYILSYWNGKKKTYFLLFSVSFHNMVHTLIYLYSSSLLTFLLAVLLVYGLVSFRLSIIESRFSCKLKIKFIILIYGLWIFLFNIYCSIFEL